MRDPWDPEDTCPGSQCQSMAEQSPKLRSSGSQVHVPCDGTERSIVREFVMDVYTLLHLKRITNKILCTHRTLYSVWCGSPDGSLVMEVGSTPAVWVSPSILALLHQGVKLSETESCRSWSNQELWTPVWLKSLWKQTHRLTGWTYSYQWERVEVGGIVRELGLTCIHYYI